ncbi:MAG: 50S ribosomal protein L9 [Patescibacteria group bacterium]
MKVILLCDIKGLGNKYDTKEVSDGHAKNFLIPRGLVKPATPGATKELTNLKAKLEKEGGETKKHLLALAERLKERSITFFVKTNAEGKTFGSITKDMILKSLRENKLITTERIDAKIDHPLKELGEHKIELDLKKDVKATLLVILQQQP